MTAQDHPGTELANRAWAAVLWRLVLGLLLNLPAWVLEYLAYQHLGSLSPRSAMAFGGGLFLGWEGALGFAAGQIFLFPMERGQTAPAELVAAEALLGLGAWAAFRYLAGERRRLPDLRSYWVFVGSAVAVSLAAAPLYETAVFDTVSTPATAFWATTLITSIILLSPLVVVLLLPPVQSLLVRFRLEVLPISKMNRRRPPLSWRASLRPAVGAVLLTLLLTAVLASLDSRESPIFHWIVLLYVLPVLWSASQLGLLAGALTGSLAGLGYLAAAPAGIESSHGIHPLMMAQQAATLFFPILGALRGAARDREVELTGRLRGGLHDVVRALQSALGAKDSYTEGHVARVSSFALEVGRKLEMDRIDLELLEVASLLHDVGKIGIPEEILHKPGPLDAEEQAIVRRHPEIGANIIEELEGLKGASPLVLHHQERFDGRREGPFPGYPAGLQGEEIPLGARIIAVVDTFDALTSDRSYRLGVSPEQAIPVLIEERGAQFDPQVVDAFLAVLEERPWDEPLD